MKGDLREYQANWHAALCFRICAHRFAGDGDGRDSTAGKPCYGQV
jgi:hypothetical protein